MSKSTAKRPARRQFVKLATAAAMGYLAVPSEAADEKGPVSVTKTPQPKTDPVAPDATWHEIKIRLTPEQTRALKKQTGKDVKDLSIKTFDLNRVGDSMAN